MSGFGSSEKRRISSFSSLLWLGLVIAAGLHVIRPLVTQTNFLDGLMYASVARNIAIGVGSVAEPQFSETLFPLFSEHPPLMMWLESLAFRAFGDTILVEKAFSLAMFFASGCILFALWRLVNRDDPLLRASAPIALLMALIAGRLGWGFSNNMLENQVIFLTSLSVYFVVRGNFSAERFCVVRVSWMAAAGLAMVLAVLTKGPVGLFPLATPGIYWIVFRQSSFVTACGDTLVMLFIAAGCFGLMLSNADSSAFIHHYINDKLGTALTGKRGSSGPYYKRVFTLLRMNFYPALVAGLIVVMSRVFEVKAIAPLGSPLGLGRFRRTLFFVFVGVSASLPITASPLLFSFYFSPSLPFYAFAITIGIAPIAVGLFELLSVNAVRSLRLGLIALFAGTVGIVGASFGRAGSDGAVLHDVDLIYSSICDSVVGCPKRLAICEPLWDDWQLHAYMQRYYKISLEVSDQFSEFVLADRDCAADLATGYVEVDKGLLEYRLFRR